MIWSWHRGPSLIDHVIPLHCTGEPFYDKARAEIPGKVLRSYTGTRFVFS